MPYAHTKIPRKTLRILKMVNEAGDGRVNPDIVADGCSLHENRARMAELTELGFITEGQGYTAKGPSGPGLYITDAGKAYLVDHEEDVTARRHEIIINILISAGTAALVAWGPNILNWIQSLIPKQ